MQRSGATAWLYASYQSVVYYSFVNVRNTGVSKCDNYCTYSKITIQKIKRKLF